MYTLHGSKGFGSAAIEAALAIGEVTHATVNAASREPDLALAELARVNPLPQVPTLLLPGGAELTKSTAIGVGAAARHFRGT